MAATLGLLALAPCAHAQEPVDLELVLAVDTSGSVDAQEFALQIHGIADAFRDPEVHAALPAVGGRGIAVTLVQWAGRRQQVVAVDWVVVKDARSARAFAGRVASTGRWILGETAIADAIAYATQLLETNQFDAPRRTIDLSGDGVTNSGIDPGVTRDVAVAAGITINGLAIVNETPDLDQYYRDHVVGGDGAFLMIARDYRDFAEAIRRKLIDEIRGAPMSGAPTGAELALRKRGPGEQGPLPGGPRGGKMRPRETGLDAPCRRAASAKTNDHQRRPTWQSSNRAGRPRRSAGASRAG